MAHLITQFLKLLFQHFLLAELPAPVAPYSVFSPATIHKTAECDQSWWQALGTCRKNQGNTEAIFYTAPVEL